MKILIILLKNNEKSWRKYFKNIFLKMHLFIRKARKEYLEMKNKMKVENSGGKSRALKQPLPWRYL